MKKNKKLKPRKQAPKSTGIIEKQAKAWNSLPGYEFVFQGRLYWVNALTEGGVLDRVKFEDHRYVVEITDGHTETVLFRKWVEQNCTDRTPAGQLEDQDDDE